MLNNFPPWVKYLYVHDPMCIDCRLRPSQELHHIFGRGRTRCHNFFSSAYNAAPVCRGCHSKIGIHSRVNRKMLLGRVMVFLEAAGYVANEKDILFLNYINDGGI